MLQYVRKTYSEFPQNVLSELGLNAVQVGPQLMMRLRAHGQEQLRLLDEGHHFRFEPEARELLGRLVTDLSEAGADAFFNQVHLPFPVMLLETVGVDGGRMIGLVQQRDDRIMCSINLVRPDNGVFPNMMVIAMTEEGKGRRHDTPLIDLLQRAGRPLGDDHLAHEYTDCYWTIRLAVSLAVITKHEGMLELKETAAVSRADRRRAAKEGRPMPAARVSVIRLGEAGKGQLAAMRGETADDRSERATVRAHWVRGHFMRTKAGNITWRMPHIRGAGPIIKQVRRVDL